MWHRRETPRGPCRNRACNKPREHTTLSLVFTLPLHECALRHLPLGGLFAGTKILLAGQFHGTPLTSGHFWHTNEMVRQLPYTSGYLSDFQFVPLMTSHDLKIYFSFFTYSYLTITGHFTSSHHIFKLHLTSVSHTTEEGIGEQPKRLVYSRNPIG